MVASKWCEGERDVKERKQQVSEVLVRNRTWRARKVIRPAAPAVGRSRRRAARVFEPATHIIEWSAERQETNAVEATCNPFSANALFWNTRQFVSPHAVESKSP